MKRLLILLFLIPVLIISCAKTDDADIKTPDGSEETEEQSTTGVDITPDFSGINYDGYNFRVISPSVYIGKFSVDEVYAEAENGEPLNDAIYRRNRKTEEILSVKIRSVISDSATFVNTVKNSVLAGSDDFDAVIATNGNTISLVKEKALMNLYKVPGIDLSKPWWDQRAVGEMSYAKNQLYYACGDINYYDDYGIMVLYFNKRLFDENKLPYPYELVRNGNWTLDEMSKLIKDFTSDIDGDGKLNENDRWGLLENNGATYHFLIGCGERVASLDENGIPVINAIGDRHIQVVEKLSGILSDKNQVLIAGGTQMPTVKDPYYDGIFKVFRNGNGLMFAEMIGTIPYFRDMEDDYGFLPLPKFDLSQDRYYSFTSYGWATSYSIPTTNRDLSRTGNIIEAMAFYSRDTLTPAVIDISLKSKFARDGESAEMLQLIIDTRRYDLGIDYQWGTLYDQYSVCTINGFGKFVSSVEKILPQANQLMEKSIAIFNELSAAGN